MISALLLTILLQTIPPVLVPPEGHTYAYGRNPGPAYHASMNGMTEYFTGQAQDDYRAAHIASVQSVPIEERIATALGVDVIPLGDETSHTTVTTTHPAITRHTIVYSTGAVSQFLLGVPPDGNSQSLMVALHGCTGTPDPVMGLAERDYTNYLGKMALERGWIVLAPYAMSLCNFLDDYNALGAITSGVDSMGYEMMKIHRQVKFVEGLYDVRYRAFYGISYGGQLAMYSAAYYDYYDALIVSGNMVRDYVPLHRSIILPVRNRYRTGTALNLRRYTTVDEILDDFVADGGTKIIIEAGTLDADIRKTLQYMATCPVCDLVYFEGRHEAAPWFTLPRLSVVSAAQETSVRALIPLVIRR